MDNQQCFRSFQQQHPSALSNTNSNVPKGLTMNTHFLRQSIKASLPLAASSFRHLLKLLIGSVLIGGLTIAHGNTLEAERAYEQGLAEVEEHRHALALEYFERAAEKGASGGAEQCWPDAAVWPSPIPQPNSV